MGRLCFTYIDIIFYCLSDLLSKFILYILHQKFFIATYSFIATDSFKVWAEWW